MSAFLTFLCTLLIVFVDPTLTESNITGSKDSPTNLKSWLSSLDSKILTVNQDGWKPSIISQIASITGQTFSRRTYEPSGQPAYENTDEKTTYGETEGATYAQPLYSQQAYSQPTYAQPAYVQPAYAQTAYAQPAYAQPAYEQPSYEQPAYEQPKYEQPAYEQPKYEQPAYEQPKYEQPTYQKPKRQKHYHHHYHYIGDSYNHGTGNGPVAVNTQVEYKDPVFVHHDYQERNDGNSDATYASDDKKEDEEEEEEHHHHHHHKHHNHHYHSVAEHQHGGHATHYNLYSQALQRSSVQNVNPTVLSTNNLVVPGPVLSPSVVAAALGTNPSLSSAALSASPAVDTSVLSANPTLNAGSRSVNPTTGVHGKNHARLRFKSSAPGRNKMSHGIHKGISAGRRNKTGAKVSSKSPKPKNKNSLLKTLADFMRR